MALGVSREDMAAVKALIDRHVQASTACWQCGKPAEARRQARIVRGLWITYRELAEAINRLERMAKE